MKYLSVNSKFWQEPQSEFFCSIELWNENSELKKREFYSYERKMIKFILEIFKFNRNVVRIQMANLNKYDLGNIPHSDVLVYTTEEKNTLIKIIKKLSGKELLFKKIFYVKSEKEFEIFLKLHFRTSKAIKLKFENINIELNGKSQFNFQIIKGENVILKHLKNTKDIIVRKENDEYK